MLHCLMRPVLPIFPLQPSPRHCLLLHFFLIQIVPKWHSSSRYYVAFLYACMHPLPPGFLHLSSNMYGTFLFPAAFNVTNGCPKRPVTQFEETCRCYGCV